MRHRLNLHLVLCLARLSCEAACRGAHPQTAEGGLQSEPIEDSGQRLAGDYIIQSQTDNYAAHNVQTAPSWTFNFNEDGSFLRKREEPGATQVETGSYLISTQGEIVLFIETLTGQALVEAR